MEGESGFLTQSQDRKNHRNPKDSPIDVFISASVVSFQYLLVKFTGLQLGPYVSIGSWRFLVLVI